MSDQTDSVIVVGGGDSGLITALALRKMNPGIGITVIDDFERDVPQVGKSTFVAFTQILHETLGIDERTFISEVRPVWKASVYFEDWAGHPPFHYTFDENRNFPNPTEDDTWEAYSFYYDRVSTSTEYETKCQALVSQGKSPWYFDAREGGLGKYPNVAYHLNTERFNAFLRKLCRNNDVSLIDDEIVSVDLAGDRIERLRGQEALYEADLYVDATGFSRVLRGEQDAAFREFDQPLDAALNARAECSLEEVVPATVIETGDHGWFWQIDTYDNRDRGYVYGSDYVSEEEAREEFAEHCPGIDADDAVKYEFDSGFYERAWIENCVAIGNAEGFVEPLQSTALTVNAKASVTLATLLSGHGRIADPAIRRTFNEWVTRTWESVRDFVAIHYHYADGETAFWEDAQSVAISPRVEALKAEFDRIGFDTHVDPLWNHDGLDDLLFFQPRDFFVMMRGMGVTSEFYESSDLEVSAATERTIEQYYDSNRTEVGEHYDYEEFYNVVLDQL